MEHVLTIERAPLQVMMQSSKRTFPDECCGFLFGRTGDGEISILTALEVSNIAAYDQDFYYEIGAEAYTGAENYADQHQLSLLGIFHSHPNQIAVPSVTDFRFALPQFLYLIISVIDKEFTAIRAWKLDEQECFVEQQINQIPPKLIQK